MQNEREFILKIKSDPMLYKQNGGDMSKAVATKVQHKWKCLAKQFNLNDDHEAQEVWAKNISGYVEYLRGGCHYKYVKEMQFMQSYLFNTDLADALPSDSEVDEYELVHVLNSYDDASQEQIESTINPAKRIKLKSVNSKETPANEEGIKTTTRKNSDNEENLSTTTQNSHNFHNLSSLELIFLGYAKVLQRLPPALQLQTKRKIADIMDEAELKALGIA